MSSKSEHNRRLYSSICSDVALFQEGLGLYLCLYNKQLLGFHSSSSGSWSDVLSTS